MSDEFRHYGAKQEDQPGPRPLSDLSSAALRLYDYAVTRPHIHPDELADALKLTLPDVHKGLAELIELRLVLPVPGANGQLTSVSPELASDVLVTPLEQQVSEQRRKIVEIRARMRALVPAYQMHAARRGLPPAEFLFERRAANDLIAKYAGLCTDHAIASRPLGEPGSESIAGPLRWEEEMLTRGVSMRILYQHGARYRESTVDCARRLAEAGAQVRTIGDRIPDMTVFDQDIGILEAVVGQQACVLIREASILRFMTISFDISWVMSQPFFTPTLEGLSDDLHKRIMHLLAEGSTDKLIARRLGISERSCQRYVKKVMDRLGAQSRFQAGYLMGASYADFIRDGS